MARILDSTTYALPDTSEFTFRPYKPKLEPEYVSRPTIGYTRNNFGQGVSGSTGIVLGDMLGNHQLAIAASLNGRLSETYFQTQYANLSEAAQLGSRRHAGSLFLLRRRVDRRIQPCRRAALSRGNGPAGAPTGLGTRLLSAQPVPADGVRRRDGQCDRRPSQPGGTVRSGHRIPDPRCVRRNHPPRRRHVPTAQRGHGVRQLPVRRRRSDDGPAIPVRDFPPGRPVAVHHVQCRLSPLRPDRGPLHPGNPGAVLRTAWAGRGSSSGSTPGFPTTCEAIPTARSTGTNAPASSSSGARTPPPGADRRISWWEPGWLSEEPSFGGRCFFGAQRAERVLSGGRGRGVLRCRVDVQAGSTSNCTGTPGTTSTRSALRSPRPASGCASTCSTS